MAVFMFDIFKLISLTRCSSEMLRNTKLAAADEWSHQDVQREGQPEFITVKCFNLFIDTLIHFFIK